MRRCTYSCWFDDVASAARIRRRSSTGAGIVWPWRCAVVRSAGVSPESPRLLSLDSSTDETVLLLNLTGDFLRPALVKMNVCFGAVLADHLHGDVNVVVAVLGLSVVDSRPSGRLSAIGVNEAHTLNAIVSDLGPLLIAEFSLISFQGQRAMPDVSVLLAGRHVLRGFLVELFNWHLNGRAVLLAWSVEHIGDIQRVITAKCLAWFNGEGHQIVASDEALIGVLVGSAWTGKVHDKSSHATTLRDIRHHVASASSGETARLGSASSMRRIVART